MAVTPSTLQLPLGAKAPDFSLPGIDGKAVSLKDLAEAKALLVIFACNHCPFVIHVRHGIAALARDYAPKGVAIVAINSNDVANYPEDRPEKMKDFAKENAWDFPYLYDETQEVAKAFRAACTPDPFLFDGARRLVYRGQLDGARPQNGVPVTGSNIRAALDAVLAGKPASPVQRPSIGCNIKWKGGRAPDYLLAEAKA